MSQEEFIVQGVVLGRISKRWRGKGKSANLVTIQPAILFGYPNGDTEEPDIKPCPNPDRYPYAPVYTWREFTELEGLSHLFPKAKREMRAARKRLFDKKVGRSR